MGIFKIFIGHPQVGFEAEQVFYLFKKLLQSGRHLVGFDLNEVGVSRDEWDENVGARCLFRLCSMLVAANPVKEK
jgi:agmatinase